MFGIWVGASDKHTAKWESCQSLQAKAPYAVTDVGKVQPDPAGFASLLVYLARWQCPAQGRVTHSLVHYWSHMLTLAEGRGGEGARGQTCSRPTSVAELKSAPLLFHYLPPCPEHSGREERSCQVIVSPRQIDDLILNCRGKSNEDSPSLSVFWSRSLYREKRYSTYSKIILLDSKIAAHPNRQGSHECRGASCV